MINILLSQRGSLVEYNVRDKLYIEQLKNYKLSCFFAILLENYGDKKVYKV